MQSFIKRYLLVLFACWLMLGQTGLAWKSATCIFTGSVTYGLGTRVSCCQKSAPIKQDFVSRASCCTYEQFQVKLSAEQRFKIVQYAFEGFEQIIPVRFFFDKRFQSERILLPIAFISSPPPSVKRALIQVYLI
jgi:hypothetical protein